MSTLELESAHILPVAAIATVIFLLKTGAVSAVLAAVAAIFRRMIRKHNSNGDDRQT